MSDPQYVDVDEEGNILNQKYPKWTEPKGNIQRMLLSAVNRKRYNDRDEQSACNEIARQCMSLTQVETPYPLEWVQFCCDWAIKKRSERKWVPLVGLLNFIRNEDKKTIWLDRNRSRYERKDGWDEIAD